MNRLYFAASMDGFIADERGGVAWLDAFQNEDFGFSEFVASIDTLVMGRTTYDQARTFDSWPYEGKRIIVLTSRPLDPLPGDVELASGGARPLAAALSSVTTGDVWIVGGAQTMGAFVDLGAVDRIDAFIMPVLLGRGVPMFKRASSEIPLRLDHEHVYPSGAVHLAYGVTEPVAGERAD